MSAIARLTVCPRLAATLAARSQRPAWLLAAPRYLKIAAILKMETFSLKLEKNEIYFLLFVYSSCMITPTLIDSGR